jgi:hypothetical protein
MIANEELKRVWREAILRDGKGFDVIFLSRLLETTERIGGLRVWNTTPLPKPKQDC